MQSIKFSIVTVCYNAVKNIENAIVSVISQTYNDIEYIIVDGGSSDGTVDVLKKYDKHIAKWISEPDNGVYDAMNKALDMATGEFILFLGADDHLLSPNTISSVVPLVSDKNIVYYGDVYRNARNDLYRGRFNKYLLACENICHQAIFYPQSVYKNMKYDLRFPIYADYVYNIRNWNNYTYVYIPVCVSYYNCLGLSGCDKSNEKFGSEMMREVKNNLGLICFFIRRIYKLYKG